MKTTLIRPIGRRNQVTLPAELLKRLSLKPGDLVDFEPREEGILLRPVAIVKKEEAWHEEDLDAIEELIEKQVRKGQYLEFDSSKKAIGALKKRIKKR